MKNDSMATTFELFVCNHDDCQEKGSKDLTGNLKRWAKEHHKGEIKVFRSGCLGKCSEGIAIACYPEKKFLLEVTLDDEKKIKKGLEEALKDMKTKT